MSTVHQQPPQHHCISTSCLRHPDDHFAGFCPSCLRERLSVLHPDASTSSSAPKSTSRTRPGSFLPELRRTQSFSVGNNDTAGLGFAGVFEPQRRSCDVRNTLWSLFSQEDGKRAAKLTGTGADRVVQGKFSSCNGFVIELKSEGVEERREQGEIEEIEKPIALNNTISNPRFQCEEQLESMEAEKLKLKQMKKHTDLDPQTKKAGARSFWSAASVFSKKLKQAWTRKNNNNNNKQKKHSGGRNLQVSKKSSAGRSYRETQSEIADYGNGRRSCDIDPRFSVDAGRMSIDDPRFSFDEPRASWDGYLIGGGRLTNLQRVGVPPMNLIALEEPRRSIHEDEGVPGGAAETKDYYLDSSSSRRRKSLDRSSSIRRTSAAVVAEINETKCAPCNAKVTPCNAKGVFKDLNPNSFRDDCSESFDRGFRDSASVINGSTKVVKKSRSWRSWNIWGLIARRGSNKGEDDDRDNGVERSYYESWQERGRDGIGVDPRGALSRNVFRSNSSVSWRNSNSNSKSIAETNGHVKRMSNEFVLARNTSARYSPNHVGNGQLKFYMTPTGGSRRGPTAKAKEAAYSHNTMAGSKLY